MKFLPVFLLATAGVAFGKGNSTSTKSQCKQVEKLTELVNLAANATRLDDKTDGNTTKASAIQAKASSAAATLQTLEANSTLMAACNQIFAVQDMEDSCSQMASLEKATALAANQTLLDAKFGNDTAKADKLKAKAAAGATELATLQGNATLTQFCAALDDAETCDTMAKLQKQVDKAANATALDAKFDGNSTKVAAFQAKASKAAAKLAVMTSNSTLVNLCAASGSGTQASTDSTTSGSASSSSSSAASGAEGISPWRLGPMISFLAVAMGAICFL
ncbi:hypothetical protein NKR23_g4036 [Pleurostoma richardsiae]|uniref:Uncharacterized protein n=1 Tax=Pleurostoma richardsiae TaxID=41990 RepID=A0AA38VGB8_9PEZI|nr:hypothetical protein NKR23_g4036 [Pleurostoma richardsiae]